MCVRACVCARACVCELLMAAPECTNMYLAASRAVVLTNAQDLSALSSFS
jgi:hypothetical protein